jgi:predicted transcriptional regulator
MRYLISVTLITLLLASMVVSISVDAEEGVKADRISFSMVVEGMTMRTYIEATYINQGDEYNIIPFRVSSIPGSFITGLNINGMDAQIVESLYDEGNGPVPNSSEEPLSGGGGDEDIESDTDDDISGSDPFTVYIEVPPSEYVSIGVTVESRIHMDQGTYSVILPMEIIENYDDFREVSFSFTDLDSHEGLGREIETYGSTLPHAHNYSTNLEYILDHRITTEPGDRVQINVKVPEDEGWYQVYGQDSGSAGYFLVSISPYRSCEEIAQVTDFALTMPQANDGGLMENFSEISGGREAIYVSPYQISSGDIDLYLEVSTPNGTIDKNYKQGNDIFIQQGWIKRYWELAWMEKILIDALEKNGGKGTRDDVIDFSIERSILSPYTTFQMGYVDQDDTTTDGGSSGKGSEFEGRTAGLEEGNDPPQNSAWEGWDDYWTGVPDDEWTKYDTPGNDDPTFLEQYWWLISLSVLLVIGVLFGGLLYSRLKEEELLKQENRKKIYEYIMENRGVHFREIQRGVDLEVGTLSHHLNILEKEQLIVSEQDGNNRRFWVAGVKRDTGKVRLSRIQENILMEIQSEPGITQVQIARRLGVSRKVVFYHVKFLSNAEMVMEEKVKRRAHYYPAD